MEWYRLDGLYLWLVCGTILAQLNDRYKTATPKSVEQVHIANVNDRFNDGGEKQGSFPSILVRSHYFSSSLCMLTPS